MFLCNAQAIFSYDFDWGIHAVRLHLHSLMQSNALSCHGGVDSILCFITKISGGADKYVIELH